LQVLNGSGVKGIAGSTKTAFTTAGFANGGPIGDADRTDYAQTQIRYVPGALAKAQVVQSWLGGIGQLVALPAASGSAAVVLVVGRDFLSVSKPGSKPTVTTTSSTLPANPGSTPGVTVPPTTGGAQVGCG
jgi:LytR cell envelope-related transcriptional attenuator